nr:type I restriction endonuclease [Flavobacterium sp.]
MTKLSESDIEQWAVEELQAVGWRYVNCAVMTPDGADSERSSFSSVILEEQLKAGIASCNPELPVRAQIKALKLVLRLKDQNIIVNNRLFHQYLTEGVPAEYRKDGAMGDDRVQLVDFNQFRNQ